MRLTKWMAIGVLLAGARTNTALAQGEMDGARPVRVGVEAFSSFAVAVKVGVAGPGIDVATPMSSRMNLRVGASFFSYNPSFTVDGINTTGTLTLRSVTEDFDWFPFGNAFRVSPGITFYNGNHITATAAVAGGQSFSLNDMDFTSSTSDPVHGSAAMSFGNQLAPSLTIGFGNMIPRKGGRWSVPFEIGAQYIGKPPQITLALGGSACTTVASQLFCQPIASTPQLLQDVQGEQNLINNDIPTQLRFFPIVSIGVGYRFGHLH